MEHRDDESSAPPGLLYRLCVSYSLATASLRSIASINGHSHRVVFTLHAKENEANQKIILGKQISEITKSKNHCCKRNASNMKK